MPDQRPTNRTNQTDRARLRCDRALGHSSARGVGIQRRAGSSRGHVSVSPGCFARRASRRPRFRFCCLPERSERQWRNTVECAPTFCLSQKKQGNPALFVCIFFFKSSNGFYEVAVIPEISNGLLTDAYRDSRLVSNDARTFLANKARARFLQKVHGDKGG
jgi:hypothetical protein